MSEIWKDIKGYEGLYEVSSTGLIKSLARYVVLFHGGGYWTTEKVLQPRVSDGYCFIALFREGNRLDIQLHILVAMAFIENPFNKKEVNHIDGNKQNNNDWNLEWSTHAENVQHGYDTGLYDSRSKLVQCLATGRRMKVNDAAKELNLSKMYLYSMLRGNQLNWTNFINY